MGDYEDGFFSSLRSLALGGFGKAVVIGALGISMVKGLESPEKVYRFKTNNSKNYNLKVGVEKNVLTQKEEYNVYLKNPEGEFQYFCESESIYKKDVDHDGDNDILVDGCPGSSKPIALIYEDGFNPENIQETDPDELYRDISALGFDTENMVE